MYKKIFAALIAMFLVTMSLIAVSSPASADKDCKPKDAYTETTGWVLTSPGAGWYQIDKRTVVDKEATPGTPEIPGKPAVPAVPPTQDHWTNLQWHVWPGNPVRPGDPIPTANDPNWAPRPAEPNGQHEVPPRVPGVPYNVSNEQSGNASWFLWTGTFVSGTPGTPAIPAVPAVPAVPGTPAVTHDEFRFAFDHKAVVCEPEEPKPPVDEPKPPVDKPEPPKVDKPDTAPKPPVKADTPAVPTAVDAGLASLPNTGAEDSTGLIALVGGMMILVGSVLFLFRKRA